MFLKNSQNPQENTCASFLIKLETEACNFIKKEILVQVFSCEFCEISKNTFFYGTPLGDSFCCLTDSWKYYLAITAQILRMMKAYCHNNQSAGKNSIAILQYIYLENFNHYCDFRFGQHETKPENDNSKVKLSSIILSKQIRFNLHSPDLNFFLNIDSTKKKFSIKNFFIKCYQIRRKLPIGHIYWKNP